MSVDLYTGILLDRHAVLTTSPDNADFYAVYTALFDELEQALRQRGINYHEPRDMESLESWHWGVKAELMPFRDAADAIAEVLGHPFAHIDACSNYSSIFLPLELPAPFYLGETAICSATALARHCEVIATALGLDETLDGGPADPSISAAIKRAKQLNADGSLPFADNQHHHAAAGCEKMRWACTYALETRTSVVLCG